MDGLGEALRTTGEVGEKGRGFGGRCWIGWMVIGEEDGSDKLQRRPGGSDDSSGWRLQGWAASAARRAGVVALRGRWVWMRSRGGFSLESRRGRWGVSRGGRGVAVGGQRRRRRVRGACREKEVQDETRPEFRLGARGGREGSRFIWQTGCCGNAGATATATATARATGQDEGPAATASAAGTASAASATRTATTTATARTRTTTTATVGARFECGDVGRDSTERFEGAVGDEVRDRGQQQRQGRRQQLQRRGRQRQHQRRPGTATTARTGTATTATATAGAMASCVEGTSRATSEEGPHRRQQRRMAAPSSASTVRRRRDPTVFGTVRRGAWPGGGHAVGDTSRASKCLGALELQRERVGWVGRAGDTPRLPSADCSGRRVWERAHHRFVGIGVTRLISNKS